MTTERRNPLADAIFGVVNDVMTAAAKGAINAGARRVQHAIRTVDDKLMLVRAATKADRARPRRRVADVPDAEVVPDDDSP